MTILGQKLFGGTVTALKLEKRKLVSVSDLVTKYGFSDETIRNKLAVINQGTNRKHMYDPEVADALLKKQTRRHGPKCIN
ncbi:DNA-binding protein [Acinetobacter sp. AG3]|uniref:DNA-binding protein n=1 Tax=Acinetobacter sp. AG3 TaxID=2912245 RepID=UPI001EF04AF2|nr:DNA-binding protein [Acinetobacter sp. AG3]